MTARHFGEKAQKDYIRYVKSFAAFLGRSPDTASAEDLRLFQQHMTKTHVSPGVINATVVALRFFFKVTLERDDLVRRLTMVSEPRIAKMRSQGSFKASPYVDTFTGWFLGLVASSLCRRLGRTARARRCCG